MKKNLFISTLAAAAVVCAVLVMSIFFASCKKFDNTLERLTPKGQPARVDTAVIHIGNNTHVVARDKDGVTIESHNGDTGEDFNGYYPLGWVGFWCDPNDTVEGSPVVNHYQLNQLAVQSYELDTLDCHVTKTVRPALDGYDQFNKNCGISFLNGYAVVFGDTVNFPRLVADLHYQTHTTSEVGSDANWAYTKVTITYRISSNYGDEERYGYKTLKHDVGDELVSITKTNEGWQPLTYSSWGWPLTAKSWIELTYHYSQSGDQVQVIEQILNYSVSTPNDTIIIRPNFNINWLNPQLGNVVVVGNSTVNNITVTSKRQNYSVGGTGFTRRFVFYWQTAVWSDGDYTFDMPSYPFTGYAETHTLDDLAPIAGYQQKKAINTVSASLNGVNGSAPANTTIRVAEEEPPTPTVVDYQIINEGLTYVNPTTNTSWLQLRAVYSDGSYGTPFNKDVNLSNAMTCPNIGPEIVSSFDDVYVVGAGQTGTEQLVNTYTVGDFTVKMYRKTFTVNLGAFTMTWTGTYEKAVYNPLNHNMPSSVYTYAVSSGAYTADLGQTLTQNTTYNRKTWTQYITATLNQHTQQHAGTAEVWAPDYIPRQTPSEFGDLLNGKYTRVQAAYGQNFQDCIAFLYENGVVLIINGNTSNPLMFAKTATLAAQLGIPQMGNPEFWYSAEYHDGGWWPAKITHASDWSSWVYVADAQHQHTCNRNNAQECNIGYEYKPIPIAQSFTKNGNVGTISYCVNNVSGTMNASVTFW